MRQKNHDKYIFFDIDGTIYTRELGIPESTQEAIARLKQNGHHPVLCTGRTKSMLFPAVKALGCKGLIAGVGAYAEWQGEPLFDDVLSPEDAKELVDNFKKFGFNPFPESTDYIYYIPALHKDPKQQIRQIFSVEDEAVIKPYVREHDVTKVSAAFTAGCDRKSFLETLKGRYRAVNHRNVLLETFPVTTSKGRGIRKLASYLGIDMENTYAFGDSFNDLEMLETVKYGVCMGNGDPKLLSRICLHAEPIQEDGVYHALKEFGLI